VRRIIPIELFFAAVWPLMAGGLSPDFFAFDNGTGRDQKLPLAQQAEILKNAGYAGMGLFTGTQRIPEALAALDAQELRLLAIYVHSYVDGNGPRIDPGLATAIRQLAGRETMIMLTLQGHGRDAEEQAVANVREVADMAEAAGLRVCLYPHVNLYVETTPDALRIVRKAGRKNVGVALNLFHTVLFHSSRCGEDDLDFRQLVRRVLPHLWMVSINGIGWQDGSPTILSLGEGGYDVGRFIRILNDAGYQGPVSLQCYQVKGDLEKNLAHSLKAWRAMWNAAAASPASRNPAK
jgi:sugar phosphate isomerase/epimerase